MDWNQIRDYLEDDEISGPVGTAIEDSLGFSKGDGGGGIFARMKKAHQPSGWAFCSVNDLVYFLDFFAFFAVAFFAATFGFTAFLTATLAFAAFAFVAIDSTPPSDGQATQ